ncbi:MAG: MFS transporter [Anditalea sp.]
MKYIKFIKKNTSMLVFGLLMTFLSSFGQTFLLALYVPFLMEDFALKNSHISTFYAIATIGSAFLLPYVGKFIDKVNIRYYTIVATALFILSLVFMGMNEKWWLIPLAFFGLRMAGQGLFSHISITAMSKYFNKGRGKAISLASLGHPLGQALLPLIVLGLIALYGWRGSLFFSAGLVLLIVPVYLFVFLKDRHLTIRDEKKSKSTLSHLPERQLTQWEIIKSKSFWLLAPNLFIMSFTVTGLFFYQFSIADFKGWDLEWMAVGLTAYAIAGSASILLAGTMIDRYSATLFFPFYLIPFLISMLCVLFISNTWIIFPYMILMGISSGFGNALKAALQVEFFGASYIGSVRSIFTSLTVLSSAVGPAVFGFMIDAGYSFDSVYIFSSFMLGLVILQSFRALSLFTLNKFRFRTKAYFSNEH